MEGDAADSAPPLPEQDSWTPVDHQHVNGDHRDVAWEETDVQIIQTDGSDQQRLSPGAGRDADTPDAEPWEQITWQMPCTSPPLSCATVQWDMLSITADASPPATDAGAPANEPDSDDATSLDAAPASPYQFEEVDAEPVTPEDGQEEDGFDSLLLSSSLVEWTGDGYEPCDAAHVQEPSEQEKEDSTDELLECNNEIPPKTDSEEEEGHAETSDPVETVDLFDILEDIQDWDLTQDVTDSFVDLKLEGEQEGPDVLLAGQVELEEEQTRANGVEGRGESEEGGEEGGEVEEEQEETNAPRAEESEAAETDSDVETPGELQRTDTGPTTNLDKLVDPRDSELSEERRHSGTEGDVEILERLHEDPTGPAEEPEMCEDVGQNVAPEQAADDVEEPAIQAADDAERIEDSELADKLVESSSQPRDCDQATSREPSPQPEDSQPEQPEMTEEPEQIRAEGTHQSGQAPTPPERADQPEEPAPSEPTARVGAKDPGATEQREQTDPSERREAQLTRSEQLPQPEMTDESETTEQLSAESEVTRGATAGAELGRVDRGDEADGDRANEDGSVRAVVANGGQTEPPETAKSLVNGAEVDREAARRLAERLYKLDGIQHVDVVKHLDKDNDFSRAVGEEYLGFFDFTGETMDHALRSFLKVVVLIGETQERERVLQHFACRFQQCNPDSFSSSGSVLALTCALMLLNTDLHGQNVGKCMSSSKFVSNLDGMNEGENFNKDLLKSLYNSIKNEPLEWAIGEEELKNSVLPDDDAAENATLRSKANPFQDVPLDRTATVVKEGFLQRKLLADIDGKRTPWGKRGWKTFYGLLKGMVLYLQKDDYKQEQPVNEEVVSVHHSLAEPAADYTKKPHVFRLQTADWRVFLFQASSRVEMNSWISRINLVSALHSSPAFPAAVGSQRRFFRPILPASQSAHTLEHQLQSHSGMLESFKADLSHLQQNLSEGKKAKAKEMEEQRLRAEYLQHEVSRYEIYIQVLEAWKGVKKTDNGSLNPGALSRFDKVICADEEDEEDGLKKSHSSPSLELEMPQPTVIKVRRNISERRTYRRTIIPRWNKEA